MIFLKQFILIKIAFLNIWRNKRRTAFCFSSVGLTVFFFVFSVSMEDGITKTVSDTVQVYELGHVRVVSSQYEAENEYMPVQYPVSEGKNWQEIASSIREIPGVLAVFPRITVMAALRENVVKNALLYGIDIKAETSVNNFNFIERNDGLIEGRWPESSANEIAIGHVFARKAGLSAGDRLPLRTFSAQFSDRLWNPVITGIFNFDYYKYDSQVIIADFYRLQRLLTLGEGTQQLLIFADNERKSPFIAAAVKNMLGENNAVTDWNDNYWVAVQKANSIIYTIAFIVILVVASFLIINTMIMIINERIKEIGMMGCLGMTRAEIVQVFAFESFFLAALGALLGATIGGILIGIMTNFPIRMGNMGMSELPMSNTVFFHFSFIRLLTGWIIGVCVTLICTLLPTLRSVFIEPVEALRR